MEPMKESKTPRLAAVALDVRRDRGRLPLGAARQGLHRPVEPHPLLPRADGLGLVRGLHRRRRCGAPAILFGGRDPRHDRAAAVAIELGLVFGVLATITGALWARIMWGAYWNWDPRQTSILISLLFYGAYLALRSGIDDDDHARPAVRGLRPAGHGGDPVPLLDRAPDHLLPPPGPGGQRAGEGATWSRAMQICSTPPAWASPRSFSGFTTCSAGSRLTPERESAPL